MKTYEVEDIRNIALIGHGDTGKTSLASAMLFLSGTVTKLGRVDDGNTVTDFEEEEIARKISLSTAVSYCEWDKTKINIVDTPGYGNFINEAKAGLRVVDNAVLLVCAVSGVEVQTEKVWDFAEDFGIPRIIILNKLDRERAGFQRALDSIQSSLGRNALAVQIPIGEEKNFKGVIDLLSMKANVFEPGGDGKARIEDIPDDLKSEASSQREKLMEMVAEMDDALLEKYFENGELSDEEFNEGLKKAVLEKKIFPVLCCSANGLVGISNILDGIVQYLPSPARMGAATGTDPKTGEETKREPSADEATSVFVFKTIADPYAGKISLFRVYSGIFKSDSNLYNVNKETGERIGSIALLQGKTQTAVKEVKAGDIASIAKLKETTTGDTLAEKEKPILYPAVEFPEPCISFAIQPKTRGDEDKLSGSLQRIAEEDPALRFGRDPQTNEVILSGTGDTHVEVTVARMKKKFGVEVLLKQPKVPYRETIRKTTTSVYRHKKQTGGAGQFAEVHLRVEPMERGDGFEYKSEIFGGSISQPFIPSIEKGIKQVMIQGVISGYPVVDIRAVVYDGKEHPVDSKDIAFQIAGREAFKKAVSEANPVLLEPIMNVSIEVPDENTGDIIGDLNSRRGRVLGMDARGNHQVIEAQVPLAEMLVYSPTLKSITADRGSFQMTLSHYAEVPANVAQKIIDESKKGKDGEEEQDKA
ncbi:elongation factor G [Acidobacteriota bacterium]